MLLLILFLCSFISADCDKYDNKDACLQNCYCTWRTKSWEGYEGKCVQDCRSGTCEGNDGWVCSGVLFISSVALLLFAGIVFIMGIGLIAGVLLFFGTALLACGIGIFCSIVAAYQKYVWVRYILWMMGGAVLCGLSIGIIYGLCNIIPMVYTAFTS